MGFFSKKSTSTTAVQNTSLGFSEVSGDAVGIVGSGNVLSDHGAISKAFEFGGSALDFGALALEQNTGLAGEVIRANNATTTQFGERISGFAAQAVQDQGDSIAQLGRYLIVGAVLLGAAFFFTRKGRA